MIFISHSKNGPKVQIITLFFVYQQLVTEVLEESWWLITILKYNKRFHAPRYHNLPNRRC